MNEVPTTAHGLHIARLSKTFPGARALRDVNLHVRPGSVHALLGHNGSGKSTLIKVLAGVHSPDPGHEILLNGTPFSCEAGEAERRGIRFVHQDLGIIDELTAMENIALTLGYQRTPTGRIDWVAQEKAARALLDRFDVSLDIWAPMTGAAAVQRSAVAIARALGGFESNGAVLVLDEPTAALPSAEADHLFEIVRRVRELGIAVIYVSHRLDEIFRIADEVTVLREGEVVLHDDVKALTPHALANAIAGREVNTLRAVAETPAATPPAFEITGLNGTTVADFSLRVRRGEIVGVAGLAGSGRDDLPYLLVGLLNPASGSWKVNGQTLESPSNKSLRRAGVALVPADRTRESIFADMTVRENTTLGILDTLRTPTRRLPKDADRKSAEQWLAAVQATPGTSERHISTLSGGNQQKVVLARWLATHPNVLILAEPTAGVDIGARQSIYDELRQQAAQGLAVVIASSDLEDLSSVCERVVVMRDGQICREISGDDVRPHTILEAMEGVRVP